MKAFIDLLYLAGAFRGGRRENSKQYMHAILQAGIYFSNNASEEATVFAHLPKILWEEMKERKSISFQLCLGFL
jgi:hypothetical protein